MTKKQKEAALIEQYDKLHNSILGDIFKMEDLINSAGYQKMMKDIDGAIKRHGEDPVACLHGDMRSYVDNLVEIIH